MTSEIIDKKRRGRKKGTPKTGGRQKGTPNRNSKTVLESLDKAAAPIIEFLVADIQALEPAQRVNEWFRLLRFCYPQLKEIEQLPAASPPAPTGPEKKPSLEGVSSEELAKIARKPTEQKANE